MRRIIVRYKLKPERVADDEQFVHAVYEELDRTQPDGFQYATFKLGDGVSFVHLAAHEAENPLDQLEAFRRFQQGIRDRCDEPPVAAELEEVGSYRFNPSAL